MITGQWVDAPKDLREDQEFYDEVGKCAERIGETVRRTAMGTKTTHTSEILFGRNGWIYSTAIEPTTDEQWDCLRASLEPEYDHVDHIYRLKVVLVQPQQLLPGVRHVVAASFAGCVKLVHWGAWVPKGALDDIVGEVLPLGFLQLSFLAAAVFELP